MITYYVGALETDSIRLILMYLYKQKTSFRSRLFFLFLLIMQKSTQYFIIYTCT